jgi:hypothetical protein
MGSTLQPDHWKPAATLGNHMDSPQRPLPIMAEAPPARAYRLLPAEVLNGATFTNVLEHMALHSGMDRQSLAAEVFISKGYLTKVLGGVGECWARLMVRMMRECRCLGPLQWIAGEMGADLVLRDSRAAEVAALKQRLQDLERAA